MRRRASEERPAARRARRRWLGLALAAAACGGAPDPAPSLEPCDEQPALFGSPNSATGLDSQRCAPRCDGCGGASFEPITASAERLAALRAWTLLDPPAVPEVDPYQGPAPAPGEPGAICGVIDRDHAAKTYRLATFPDLASLRVAGGEPTHTGPCGLCSSLDDLAVYLGDPDLGRPVRDCALVGIAEGDQAAYDCLVELGLTAPCAKIWLYNTIHTRSACLSVCGLAPPEPYNGPDGSLHPCLQCDEDQSGPVFAAVAGRTRRNSGIATAICRPCDQTFPLAHAYDAPPGPGASAPEAR